MAGGGGGTADKGLIGRDSAQFTASSDSPVPECCQYEFPNTCVLHLVLTRHNTWPKGRMQGGPGRMGQEKRCVHQL